MWEITQGGASLPSRRCDSLTRGGKDIGRMIGMLEALLYIGRIHQKIYWGRKKDTEADFSYIHILVYLKYIIG